MVLILIPFNAWRQHLSRKMYKCRALIVYKYSVFRTIDDTRMNADADATVSMTSFYCSNIHLHSCIVASKGCSTIG